METLSNTRVLWASFVATALCTAAFPVVAGHYGLVLLDAISDPEQSRTVIAAMSETQRTAHAWITGTLDVLYPAVYGALFAGSAYCFFPRIGRWLALPIVLLVVIDLAEGLVQILGLTGAADWLDAKAVLTPAKMLLVYYGLLVVLCGWIAWLVRRLRKSE